jgi:hypothetical protein
MRESPSTLQGEGRNTGRAAVFCRFTGCNLWSGRVEDRHRGPSCSRWCDTEFVGTDGSGGGRFSTPVELVSSVTATWPIGRTTLSPVTVGSSFSPVVNPSSRSMNRSLSRSTSQDLRWRSKPTVRDYHLQALTGCALVRRQIRSWFFALVTNSSLFSHNRGRTRAILRLGVRLLLPSADGRSERRREHPSRCRVLHGTSSVATESSNAQTARHSVIRRVGT